MAKIEMRFIGEDGNAFAILGRFRRAAVKAGLPKERIDAIVSEAMSGDYNHLLARIVQAVDES